MKRFLFHIIVATDVLTFGDTEIEKNKFYRSKTTIVFKKCRY